MTAALLGLTGAGTATEPSIGSSLLHMVLGLAAVIAAILVVTKILQFVRGGGGARPRQRRAATGLEVLARQSLGKGVQVAVVRYDGREVLVGVAGQHISFFEEAAPAPVGPPPELAIGAPAPSGEGTSGLDDLAALEAMLRRAAPATARPQLVAAPVPSLLERLRSVTERH